MHRMIGRFACLKVVSVTPIYFWGYRSLFYNRYPMPIATPNDAEFLLLTSNFTDANLITKAYLFQKEHWTEHSRTNCNLFSQRDSNSVSWNILWNLFALNKLWFFKQTLASNFTDANLILRLSLSNQKERWIELYRPRLNVIFFRRVNPITCRGTFFETYLR
mgnify:CR=1 FL=1